MTESDKRILQDISARYTYGVVCLTNDSYVDPLTNEDLGQLKGKLIAINDEWCNFKDINDNKPFSVEIGGFKPILRPMEDMTEEEFAEYEKENDKDCDESSKTIRLNLQGKKHISSWHHGVDWLNKNMFDFRGLIPDGLAIKSTRQ